MERLFSPDFWFKLTPGELSGTAFKVFVAAAIAALAGAIVFGILAKTKRQSAFWPALRSTYNFFLAQVFMVLALFFFGYQMLPLLSARFWYLLWLAGTIVWLVFLVKKCLAIPERLKTKAEENAYRKYLPR